MSSPVPFTIDIPTTAIEELKTKLAAAKYPDELEDVGWDYGVPLDDVKRLVDVWLKEYDWKVHEKTLNETLPQFTLDIEVEGHGTLNVHFVHARSVRENAIPLLFVHGWPGSFHEVSKILPLLATPPDESKPAFHVVAISLPGFGFSDAPKKKGFAVREHAETGHKLMLALGYNEYVVQGGDWGSWVSRFIAAIYGGKHCKSIHRNMVTIVQPPKLLQNPLLWLKNKVTPLTEAEKLNMERVKWFGSVGRGYFQIQATQPQTLGYGLADSPVGLLAWIYEKIHNWSDDCPFTDDEILTWISIYYFSKPGPTASTRIYYEYIHHTSVHSFPTDNRKIPQGFSLFPKEMVFMPRVLRQTLGNIVFEKTHDKGGHFAALERPDELAADLREMYGKGGPAFGVVTNKNGY